MRAAEAITKLIDHNRILTEMIRGEMEGFCGFEERVVVGEAKHCMNGISACLSMVKTDRTDATNTRRAERAPSVEKCMLMVDDDHDGPSPSAQVSRARQVLKIEQGYQHNVLLSRVMPPLRASQNEAIIAIFQRTHTEYESKKINRVSNK